MAHHRNARIGHRPDSFLDADAAFQLDRFGSAFLEKPAGIPQRLVRACLIRKKRHVADHQCALAAACDQASVIDHLVHCDRQRVGTSLNHAAQRVTDKQHLHPGLIKDAGESVVVRRQTGNPLAALFHLHDMRHGDLIAHHNPPTKKPSGPIRKAKEGGRSRPGFFLVIFSMPPVSVQSTWIQAVCSAASPTPYC
jgi:hypothetical protein